MIASTEPHSPSPSAPAKALHLISLSEHFAATQINADRQEYF